MSHVLIVEDEQHLADGLRFNLEAEGYQVDVADSGEAAQELLKGISPDVIVLDVMLPGKDGFTVMSEMRDAGQFVPTLMLTARGHPDDVLKGFAAGADDYLTKPFELSILIARIRGLLRRREWLAISAPASPCRGRKTVLYLATNQSNSISRTPRRRPGFSADPDGSQRPALPDPRMKARLCRARRCWKKYGACMKTPTLARSTISSSACAAISSDDPANPEHLLTVRGVGYRFRGPRRAEKVIYLIGR